MSRDKTALPGADMPPSWTDARPPLVVLPLLLCPSHLSCFSLMLISLLMSLPSHLPLVILSVMLCHSCCLFLSPAVSLSGLGVGFGDSVLWILPWLRPKLLGPHGAAASPGPLPAHPFLLFFFSPFLLLFLALELWPTPTPPPDLSPPCVSYAPSICHILFRGNSL